jgi:hypothetical protein
MMEAKLVSHPHVSATSSIQSLSSLASTALLEYFALTMATMVVNAYHHHGDRTPTPLVVSTLAISFVAITMPNTLV